MLLGGGNILEVGGISGELDGGSMLVGGSIGLGD